MKTKCPECEHLRKPENRNQKPFSIDKVTGLYYCHNCGNKGMKDRDRNVMFKPVAPVKKSYQPCPFKPQTPEELHKASMEKWFKLRGIPLDLVLQRGISVRRAYLPETSKEEWVITFPFYKQGTIVNAKNRGTRIKAFSLEKGCEAVFYGLETIPAECLTLVLCEGELDQLSLQLAGYNAISVPSGANSPLDECLQSAESLLMGVERFILAGDADVAGRELMSRLSQRIGQEKCFSVTWPSDCKDANDVLVKHGIAVLKQCVDGAKPLPIAGTITVDDLRERLWDAYEVGFPAGVHPGWNNLNEYYHPRPGETTYMTGVPGSGKSCFVSAMSVNLAMTQNWRFTIFTPEQYPPDNYYAHLMELYVGKPLNYGPKERMSMEEASDAMDWLQDRFLLLDLNECRTLEDILDVAGRHVFRYGIKGLVLDPWNEIDHNMKNFPNEHSYIAYALRLIRRFAQRHQVHVWIVAHPTKPGKPRDSGSEEAVPSLYDIAGSSNFYNKADNGLIMHRDKADTKGKVTVFISKIRFKYSGKLGKCELYHDRATGRYDEVPTIVVGADDE